MSSKVFRLLLLFALLDAGLASRVIAGAATASPILPSVHAAAQVSVRAVRDALPIGRSDRFQWLSPTGLARSLDDAVTLGVGGCGSTSPGTPSSTNPQASPTPEGGLDFRRQASKIQTTPSPGSPGTAGIGDRNQAS
jgi:hypothetical protein